MLFKLIKRQKKTKEFLKYAVCKNLKLGGKTGSKNRTKMPAARPETMAKVMAVLIFCRGNLESGKNLIRPEVAPSKLSLETVVIKEKTVLAAPIWEEVYILATTVQKTKPRPIKAAEDDNR